ncbi:TPA: hypothetical protein EYP70_05010 [Candidatus Bathyarchaeota archaeon]|nr:hypothetical protein [Candidatus Bathyarchaeota archaeon]
MTKQIDIFNQTGSKLVFLLGLQPYARILFVGRRTKRWYEELRGRFDCHITSDSLGPEVEPHGSASCQMQTTKNYQLIIWDISSENNLMTLNRQLMKVRDHLAPNGRLALLASNRYSLHRFLGRYILRTGYAQWPGPCLSSCNYKALLKKAGFSEVMEFLAIPNLESMEELVASDIGYIQFPAYYHIIFKIAQALGCYKFINDDYLYIASIKEENPIKGFLSWLQIRLAEKLEYNYKLKLTKCLLQQRGALILLIRDIISRKQFVVRVATSPEIDIKISRNNFWITEILSNERIPQDVKNKMPKPLGKLEYLRSFLYIEEMLPGILAWKVKAKERINSKIFTNAYQFIYELNKSTSQLITINDEIFNDLVKKDVDILMTQLSDIEDSKKVIGDITTYLKIRLLNRKHYLVWGHGDYSYGNILVDPKNGELLGVIDWDNGRNREFPGIDLLNLIIQSHRGKKSLGRCFQEVWESSLSKGLIAPNTEGHYEKVFGISKTNSGVILALFCLHFFGREAQYSSSFLSIKKECFTVMTWLKDKLYS